MVHWATLTRITRASMIEEIDKDYVTAARARGLPRRRVVWRHALANAIGPGLTGIALSTTMGFAVFSMLLVMLLSDLLLVILDPRLRGAMEA